LFEDATGIDRTRLIGHTPQEVFPPDFVTEIGHQDDMVRACRSLTRFEVSRPRRHGGTRDHVVTKVPLFDRNGELDAILTLAVDISDQKALQRELLAAKTEAEHHASVKTAFLANMSHEIRTPLHAVLGLTQVGQTLQPCDPQLHGILRRIGRSGQHLLGVINDILDFTKIGEGKLTLDDIPLDPRQLTQDAVAMLERSAQDKGLRLQLHCGDVPPAVLGDPLRLRQILLNLVGNAIKFTERGDIDVSLRAQSGALYIDVQDTGIGMHPHTMRRLFHAFEQADGSTSRRFGGTGLGLSISRELARLMGGDLQARSVLGQGSTFTLSLPLRATDPHALPPAPPVSALAADAPHVPRLGQLRLLAVDDVDTNLDILQGLLVREGAKVTLVDGGRKAVQLVKQHGAGHFDLVLMDVQMPTMNGLQATELIHMLDADLPVLALTAHALPDEVARCKAAGMVGHLPKPFDAEDMIALILQRTRRPAVPLAQPTPPAPPVASTTNPTIGAPQLQVVGAGVTAGHEAAVAPPPWACAQDYEATLQRCGRQPDLLRQLVQRFCHDQADFVARVNTWLEDDPGQARRAAHALRGTVGNLGLLALAQGVSRLEAAIADEAQAELPEALRTLDDAITRHIAALNAWLGEHESVA
jgi:PAS domain S-box-containing protein